MTPELHQYIQTEIMPTAGLVETGLEITELQLLTTWLRKNMRVELQPTMENLTSYLLSPDDEILHKNRRLYLNPIDYHLLDCANVEDVAICAHKEILNVLIIADGLSKPGDFWYLTDDEFMIMKSI